ncbi:MAG: sulfatase-like hydrolase/transferase, partial [Phycisphaerales bacterium]|nr:sulfatase-like hydrolase/transferase [Phycisphaerales bacterium]
MTNRPNILYVFADQLRYDTLGCTGNKLVKTPHIDRLAQEGILMANTFSACPICGPYRAQLLTGRYSHANGVMDNEYRLWNNQTTIAQTLTQAGYRTAYVGKLHLGPGPYTKERRLGFDDMIANNCAHHYFNVKYYHNEVGPIVIDGYGPRGETELALATIRCYRQESPEKPFALFLAWGPP